MFLQHIENQLPNYMALYPSQEYGSLPIDMWFNLILLWNTPSENLYWVVLQEQFMEFLCEDNKLR